MAAKVVVLRRNIAGHHRPGSDNRVPGYGIVNARLTYAPEGRAWDVSVSAENLLDKFYWYQIGPARSTLDQTVTDNRTGSPARPRELAVTFRRNFN
ncbi:MAG: TonB-dependent receptor [Chitinophagaceae bacterium]|nr:MAG: TonB-dependent receptor [Chitinophagaceae bacterium]